MGRHGSELIAEFLRGLGVDAVARHDPWVYVTASDGRTLCIEAVDGRLVASVWDPARRTEVERAG